MKQRRVSERLVKRRVERIRAEKQAAEVHGARWADLFAGAGGTSTGLARAARIERRPA